MIPRKKLKISVKILTKRINMHGFHYRKLKVF